ncbi:hypothetical protein F5Y14DRAFT_25751 [Nemania sp. NC0429]|nr:hypothetical protein F5Y14DRAFT_25751 [Nemania sp. NC0429]
MWSFGTTMTISKEGDSASNSTPPPPPSRSDPMPPTPPTPPTPLAPSPPPAPAALPYTRPSVLSQRSLKQLGLFFAGAGFLSLATLITRRSVARKLRVTMPKFYVQSNRPVNKLDSDGPLIALEALNLATLNVLGFGVMMAGGLSWAFDVSGIEDLRRMARRQLGPSGGRTDEESEREIEEWVAKVLLRKDKDEAATAAASPTARR